MILQFSVKNFRTFKEKATLSLIASNYDKDTREGENIVTDAKYGYRILKSAVVYGANASGKSKFIEALAFMRYFVGNSSKESQKGESIDVYPFLLSKETENEPSEFEVNFIHNDILYRYGFEATAQRVISEWLYYRPKTKEIELFYRDGSDIVTHEKDFTKGKVIVKEKMIRDNALMISVAAQFNETTAIQVLDWFKRMKVLSGNSEQQYWSYTIAQTENLAQKRKILDMLLAADIGIEDVFVQKVDIDNLPKETSESMRAQIIKNIKEKNAKYISDVLTMHKQFDRSNNLVGTIPFSLDGDESAGTRKYFYLTGPLLNVLENGYILAVDELDSKLHPNLVCKIVSLFNSKEFNPKNAQLIFNSHDTNLLSSGLFRRDQIWFTKKDKFGAAKLYSLADFKSSEVRKHDLLEENYVIGKYGAVPYLGNFDRLKNLWENNEDEE